MNYLTFSLSRAIVLDVDLDKNGIEVVFCHEDIKTPHRLICNINNFIESIEARDGEEMYQLMSEYSDECDNICRFLQVYEYGDRFDDDDLIRFIGEELRYATLSEYDFLLMNKEEKDAYIELCYEHSSFEHPEWFRVYSEIMMIKAQKVSSEAWQVISSLLF